MRFDPNKRGVFEAVERIENSPVMTVVLALLLGLAFVGMLVFVLRR